jgi:hydroxyacylglutathione hydrolase
MRPMLVTGFPAGTFQTNCWLVATGPGSEALVVDPGQDALPGVRELCARHRLKPVAALLTHGHLDHVWTVAPLAGAHDIPAYIHPADRHLLTDPLSGFGPEARAAFGGLSLQEPDDVRELADGQLVELAGLRLTVDHTPGHTLGHVTFRSDGDGEPGHLLAGDLVFAGSIGRTDLPGGSTRQMLASLASRFLTLPDEMVVLPGHGPTTTVGQERETNPFLAGLAPAPGGSGGVKDSPPVNQGSGGVETSPPMHRGTRS